MTKGSIDEQILKALERKNKTQEDLKEKYIQEIAQGLRSKQSYMVRFMGMTEEEAKQELARINEEDSLSSLDLTNEDEGN